MKHLVAIKLWEEAKRAELNPGPSCCVRTWLCKFTICFYYFYYKFQLMKQNVCYAKPQVLAGR